MVCVASTQAAPLGVIDQQNTIATNRFFSGQNIIGQSFVPTLPGIDAIEFNLGSNTFGSSIYINVRDGLAGPDGLSGPILGTSNTLVLESDAPIQTRQTTWIGTVGSQFSVRQQH